MALGHDARRNELRKYETNVTLDQLRAEVDGWIATRRASNDAGRYFTQLADLQRALEGLMATVAYAHDRIDVTLPAGVVYKACRDADTRTAVVRRISDWFRDKWDQRDDPVLGPMLRAADQVIWSCYQEPFVRLARQPPAAPLPYVEPRYGANAITRAAPPGQLRDDALLRKATQTLPVPVIGLPAQCASLPWWLAVVVHETGHQVYADLEGGGLALAFEDAVAAAAQRGAPNGFGDWRQWTSEVFADAYSAMLVGPAASWVLGELETVPDDDLLKNTPTYPPRLVRRAVVESLLDHADVRADAAVPPRTPMPDVDSLNLPASLELDRERVRSQLQAASAVARAIWEEDLGGLGTLPSLCGFDATVFRRDGSVEIWRDDLITGDAQARADDVAAREALVGGVAAWLGIARRSSDAVLLPEGAKALAQRLLQILPECAASDVRAAPPAPDIEAVIAALGQELLQIEAVEY